SAPLWTHSRERSRHPAPTSGCPCSTWRCSRWDIWCSRGSRCEGLLKGGPRISRMAFPVTRLRRMRRTGPLRALIRETDLTAEHLVQPMFITAGEGVRDPISSMPGMERLSISEAVAEVTEIAAAGVRAVLLFGIPATKDEVGSEAYDDEGVIQMAV